MRKYKFLTKLVYINIVALICITTILFSLFAVYYVTENNKQFRKSTELNADAVANTITQNLFFADNTAVQLGNNPYIKDVLAKLYFDESKGNYFDLEPVEEKTIVNYLMPYLIKENMIYRILVYNKNGDFLVGGAGVVKESTNTYISGLNYTETEKSLETKGSKSYRIYDEDPLQDINHSPNGYVALIRPITDNKVRNGSTLGYIEVQIPFSGLLKQIDSLGIGGNYQVAKEGTLFLEQETFVNIQGGYTAEKIIDHDFSIQVQDQNQRGKRLVIITIIVLILILTLMIVSMIMIQKRIIIRITRPLISLFQTVENTDLESVSKLEENDSIDELLELQQTFNNMIDSLKSSVDQMVVMRTEKLKAQMLALQAQVNPHFIHNTLSVISSLAEEGETEKVTSVSQKLSQMIRYSSDYSTQEVFIHQEMETIITYLELVKYRYEDVFNYTVTIEDDCMGITVPKFILQPLVENAIKHSLKKADFPWQITVRCYLCDEKWFIELTDNGGGIEKEKINSLKNFVKGLNDSSTDELLKNLKIGGFSLMNTLIRMYIRYHEEMEFDIYKNRQGGTTVIIGGVAK